MIGQLRGTLEKKQPPWLLIDVNGVGYEAQAPMSTFYQLPDTEKPVKLLMHLVVREDAQLLYAFATNTERELFRALIKVNGIGAKVALNILSGMAADEFIQAVDQHDASSLTRIPGIGKKTAERLLIEMRDRLETLSQNLDTSQLNSTDSINMNQQNKQEALSALSALGYKPSEAKKSLERVYQPDTPAEELIRQCLKQMITRSPA